MDHKQRIREEMMKMLWDSTEYPQAGGALSAIFGENYSPDGIPFFEGLLEVTAEGKDFVVTNDSSVYFPNELAIEYGQPEGQYGYVEMGNSSLPDDEGIDRVPFDEALRLIEIAAKYYVDYRPDRANRVTELLVKGRKSFARLQKSHDRWKRQNG